MKFGSMRTHKNCCGTVGAADHTDSGGEGCVYLCAAVLFAPGLVTIRAVLYHKALPGYIRHQGIAHGKGVSGKFQVGIVECVFRQFLMFQFVNCQGIDFPGERVSQGNTFPNGGSHKMLSGDIHSLALHAYRKGIQILTGRFSPGVAPPMKCPAFSFIQTVVSQDAPDRSESGCPWQCRSAEFHRAHKKPEARSHHSHVLLAILAGCR